MSRFYSNMERDIFVKVSKTYLGVWDMSEVHLTLGHYYYSIKGNKTFSLLNRFFMKLNSKSEFLFEFVLCPSFVF